MLAVCRDHQLRIGLCTDITSLRYAINGPLAVPGDVYKA